MNRNYQVGRRMEWDRKKYWESKDYAVVRSAGSHGFWDLCAVKSNEPVNLIQCKVTETPTVAKNMLKGFKENPPLTPSKYFHQILEVKIKGSTEVLTAVM